MDVTLHGNNPGLLARAILVIQEQGWECFKRRWDFFPEVAVSVGHHVSEDVRKDYRYHETIVIPL